MDRIHVVGNIPLQGKCKIQGSKNASLPILAACLLTEGTTGLYRCPRIRDVQSMFSLLQSLGCSVFRTKDAVMVDSTGALFCGDRFCSVEVTGMRSSLCLLGAMIGRFGRAVLDYPGGCVIGARPIDLHLKMLGEMGVVFSEEEGVLHACAKHLRGARLVLPFPSVGATENVILAAVAAEGDTTLIGAAREPEVTALCHFLSDCGAKIEGIGTDCLHVEGGHRLFGTDYAIPADRIVAGTYFFACIGAGGQIFLEDAPWQEMENVLAVGKAFGAKICTNHRGLYVQGPDRPKAIGTLFTDVYPGFPTDLQSMVLVTAAVAEGETRIREQIFENRFQVSEELQRMGADIRLVDEKTVLVRGTDRLTGTPVRARELRGGAALVGAGVLARGETVVGGCEFIERGYERICADYRELGVRITGA
ncbi:MAG: UDP-N-acetylglucosamine 1-carboxyvinyltransferase [Acetatifactor sp.]